MNQLQNLRPRFQVEKLEGTMNVTVTYYESKKIDDKRSANVRKTKVETRPRGYMVYLSKGDSIHIPNEAELRRLGFDRDPDLIDMESGESVPNVALSLKKHVQRKTKVRRNSVPAEDSVVTLDDDEGD